MERYSSVQRRSDIFSEVGCLTPHEALDAILQKIDYPVSSDEGYAAQAVLESDEFHTIIFSSKDPILRARHAFSMGIPLDEVVSMYDSPSDEVRGYASLDEEETKLNNQFSRMEIEEHFRESAPRFFGANQSYLRNCFDDIGLQWFLHGLKNANMDGNIMLRLNFYELMGFHLGVRHSKEKHLFTPVEIEENDLYSLVNLHLHVGMQSYHKRRKNDETYSSTEQKINPHSTGLRMRLDGISVGSEEALKSSLLEDNKSLVGDRQYHNPKRCMGKQDIIVWNGPIRKKKGTRDYHTPLAKAIYDILKKKYLQVA